MQVSRSRTFAYNRDATYYALEKDFHPKPNGIDRITISRSTPIIAIADMRRHGFSDQAIYDDLVALGLDDWLYLLG